MKVKTVSDGLLLTTSGGNLSTSATSTNGLVKIKNRHVRGIRFYLPIIMSDSSQTNRYISQ